MNPWQASYLRRGIDQITENGTTTTVVRHAQSVEKDDVIVVPSACFALTGKTAVVSERVVMPHTSSFSTAGLYR